MCLPIAISMLEVVLNCVHLYIESVKASTTYLSRVSVRFQCYVF